MEISSHISLLSVILSFSGIFNIFVKHLCNTFFSIFDLLAIFVSTFNISPSLFSGKTLKKKLFISPPKVSSIGVKLSKKDEACIICIVSGNPTILF